ncbi:hypothetical protein PMAYCL1PPCAC_30984, partial [Pristionchus mayeri]
VTANEISCPDNMKLTLSATPDKYSGEYADKATCILGRWTGKKFTNPPHYFVEKNGYYTCAVKGGGCIKPTYHPDCLDGSAKCNDNVEYKENDYLRCKGKKNFLIVGTDADNTFSLDEDEGLKCDVTTGKWYDENNRDLDFNPTLFQCARDAAGCDPPTYTDNVCKAGEDCDES